MSRVLVVVDIMFLGGSKKCSHKTFFVLGQLSKIAKEHVHYN